MTAVQPFLFADTQWVHVRDGNPSAMAIFMRHYTARSSRKVFQMIGPGQKMLLLTPDALAVFAWRKFISDAGEDGVNCAVFRNEGAAGGRSSDLIRAADAIAWERWPGERLYTYVDPRLTRHKRDPGRCFLRAGWRHAGWTKSGLRILECVPVRH
jgi:hypothetical protein